MKSLPKISGVISTRDRPRDLAELLTTILNQSHPPYEVIIIDDSHDSSAKDVVNSFDSQFVSVGCKLRYIKGTGDGLPSARNLGVNASRGEAVLFLDDDTLLDDNVISALATFLRDEPTALGVQPKILSSTKNRLKSGLATKSKNAIFKAFMLTYREKNRLGVRRSGASVLHDDLTKVISAQRLSGCCCCYRREVFSKLSFDTSLKRWGFMEDLDFSYRLHKIRPQSLYAIPYAKTVHKLSEEARLPTNTLTHMKTTYFLYVFFKDIFESSMLNLVALLLALMGNLVIVIGGLMAKMKPKHRWWELIYLIKSYFYVFRHLGEVFRRDLGFFNVQIKE